ncbi:MAG: protease complex subunit PrcB family protein [Pyrinomonadaceae bacterium]
MKKLSGLLLFCVFLGSSVNSLGCNLQGGKQNSRLKDSKATPPAPSPGLEDRSVITIGEIKELAAGNHSTIFESFVLIARDPKTYAALRAASNTLPEQSADFFESHVVVAAFLGQRSTGGFRVEITSGADGSLRIVEHTPPKDAMVTMALTAPFRIVAIPVKTDQAIVLSLDETWKNRLSSYRVTSGQLSITGGFAGVNQRLQLDGVIGVMRASELATFVFELQSKGGKETRHLIDTASCIVEKSGRVSLPRLSSFALTGAVQSPFRATGEFSDNERALRLSLQTVGSPNISDNFGATAELMAVATGSQPSQN